MSRALGVASYQEGRGRVVAFTKAFSIQDFTFLVRIKIFY